MKIQLQNFFHKVSPYARPNQSWVCGKYAQGNSCEAGPDKKGRCRTEYECTPYKEKDSWVCTRSHAYVGSCTDGPLPDGQCCKKITGCLPIASVRTKRGLFVKWTVFITLAIFLFLLNSHLKAGFFSPGDLTVKHAKIEQCSSCHEVFDRTFFEWIKEALSGNKMVNRSQKCLDCHQFSKHAFNAHGLIPENLNKSVQSKNNVTEKNQKQIACMTCHHEHHGLDFNLKTVAQQNCVFCHDLGQSFFEEKHPEFDQYPHRRNSGIIFDHSIHANKYYYNKAGDQLIETAPNACVSCHKSDTHGIKMLHGGYDKDCKACHNKQFEKAESLLVFDIPKIAIDKVPGVEWPKDANGRLTSFMILLLSTDQFFIDAVADLDEYHDLTDLDEHKTLKIIKAIKNLFHDMENNGPVIFKQRLAEIFNCQLNVQRRFDTDPGCHINESDLDQLVNLVPMNIICEGKRRWFPNLASEYDKTSVDGKNEKFYCDNKNKNFEMNVLQGKWTLGDFSIKYRPVAHEDLFIKIWLNLSSHQMHQPIVENVRMQLFNKLASDDATVKCTKCHGVESRDGKNFIVHWLALDDKLPVKGFVKFKHDVHIKYQDETICNDCHHENKKGDYLIGYNDQDPITFVSDFVTETKDCSSCHKQSMVKDQCQKCHNYHVSVE